MTERLIDKNPCNDCKLYSPCTGPCGKWHEWNRNVLQKLAEYETAEEEGRLVVLPCKVGTRVYEIYQFCGYGAWEIEEHKIKLEDLDKIGKTVFPTREEAEKALKKMEGKLWANL